MDSMARAPSGWTKVCYRKLQLCPCMDSTARAPSCWTKVCYRKLQLCPCMDSTARAPSGWTKVCYRKLQLCPCMDSTARAPSGWTTVPYWKLQPYISLVSLHSTTFFRYHLLACQLYQSSDKYITQSLPQHSHFRNAHNLSTPFCLCD
jgi:hypothetical protein